MPLYEFECDKCNARGEVVQSFGASPLICPDCGADMRRLISLPADNTKGTERGARRKWMRDWTPDSPKFHTGSLRGEKY